MNLSRADKQTPCGFTLVEVIIVIAIIGILAAVAAPVMNTFRKRAEYNSLMATLNQLMDGQDAYYILNNAFYPASGIISVNSGQDMDIPDLGFRFSSGHKHRYWIRGMNFPWGAGQLNYYLIYVFADDDYNGDGRNDYYLVRSLFLNGEPLQVGNTTYDRLLQQYW